MTKRLISFLIALCLFIAIPLSARYKYNPFTRKLDYYEPVSGSDLGDLGDVTLTGLATGNILYYNGTAWVNLATGANTNVLTLAGGVPTWAAPGAPAAHAASHEVGGADLVDHDQLTNYLVAQHLTLPNTIVAVLTDHNLVAHTALGLFDASADVDHDATTNWVANKHIDWTAATDNFSTSGTFTNTMNLAAEVMSITQTAMAGPGGSPLINIDDDRTGVTANAVGEATIVMNAAGTYALYIQTGGAQFDGVINGAFFSLVDTNNYIWSNAVPAGLAGATSNIIIGYQAGEDLTSGDNNVLIGTAAGRKTTTDSGNVVIGYGAGLLQPSGSVEQVIIGKEAGYGTAGSTSRDNVIIGAYAGYSITSGQDNVLLGQQAGYNLTSGQRNVIIGYMAGEGWLDTENDKLIIDNSDTATPLIYGDFSADNITINGDFNVTMDAALDQIVFAQSAVAGTEDQPLIFINDDRTGATANELSESTLIIEAAGWYSLWVKDGSLQVDGASFFTQQATHSHHILVNSNANMMWGSSEDIVTQFDLNGASDDLWIFLTGNAQGANETTALWYGYMNPNGMSTHDDYMSPTFIITNSEGADANDYAGVVIGERAQADVKIAHYFDFWAMTGAVDGAVDPANAELAAIFRFGASGTTVPITATTPGDVLFEGKIESADWIRYDATDYNQTYGWQAGNSLTPAQGTGNIFFGYQTGIDTTTGDTNVAIGYRALYENVEGSNNVALGEYALQGITGNDYSNNVAIGYRTIKNVTSGGNNVAVGSSALGDLSSGTYNIGIGSSAGKGISTGSYGVFLGYNAGFDATGAGNTVIGASSGYFLDAGGGNTIIGYQSGLGVNANNQEKNVYIGYKTAFTATTSSNNVVIGYMAAEDITSGTDNVVIGYMAGEGWLVAQTNQLIVANTDTATPLLHGDFTTGDLVSASLTHNSDHEVTGYRRSSTIKWIDCFDHGSTVAKYGQDWDLTALNTQGNGTNDIDTNPSNITLTTDDNGVGDNEGTRTDLAIIDRARLNRSEIGCTLGQTVNTSFFWGWNTSGTNAMVAAADEYVIVFFDVSNNANWQIKVGDGGTEDVFTSGIAADTNFIRHEIWVESGGTVHWRINGTEVDITGTVDNLMTASDHYLIVGQAQSVTGAAVIVVEIDHVENEKTKAH